MGGVSVRKPLSPHDNPLSAFLRHWATKGRSCGRPAVICTIVVLQWEMGSQVCLLLPVSPGKLAKKLQLHKGFEQAFLKVLYLAGLGCLSPRSGDHSAHGNGNSQLHSEGDLSSLEDRTASRLENSIATM
ncbi:hypothetical protein D3C78_1248750 [compost metagenome]